MIVLISEALRLGRVSLEGLMKITGKVSYYGKLVHGKFEMGFLFSTMVQTQRRKHKCKGDMIRI